MNKILTIFFIAILTCLSAGCSAPLSKSKSTDFSQLQILNQARYYSKKAQQGGDNVALNLLKAADYYIQANYINEAEKLISSLPSSIVVASQEDYYSHILQAQIALLKQSPLQAKKLLNHIWTPKQLPNDLLSKYYAISAKIYTNVNNPVLAVQEHINLAKYISSAEEEELNNQAILNILNQLTPNTLASLQTNDNTIVSGWLAYAYLNKQYDANHNQLSRAIKLWKQRFPYHPANRMLTKHENYNDNFSNLSNKKPQKIALMLPLQGPYSSSAQAIKNGFFTAFYNNQTNNSNINSNRLEINIYDTNQKNIAKLYKKIIADGNDFVVGPLTKTEIENINKIPNLDIPVLALNTIANQSSANQFSSSKITRNLLQFGLPPEAESPMIATKAWHDGCRRVILIVVNNTWGQRMAQSLKEHWEKIGGIIIQTEKITENSDLNTVISKLLSIDTSKLRAMNLRKMGVKVNFEPRRRQDIDAIFIATNANLARQIKPLLNFYYANDLPVYASSSIYEGIHAPLQDQDLNDIQFCDMPWVLDKSIASRNIYKNMAKLWPNQFTKYTKLYALGVDAYKISLQLDKLLSLPNFSLSGMTGMLSLDKHNKIQRQLMWARFKNGIPQLIGNSSIDN